MQSSSFLTILNLSEYYDGKMMAFPGGKGKSFQKIINLMPPHRIYIEPFLGGGAVVRNKKPAQITVVGDLNKLHIQEFNCNLPNLYACHDDALDLLHSQKLCNETLVYCDPPYLHETRRKNKIYRYEFSDAQHENLLQYLVEQACMVLVSGYENEMYNDLLRGWNKSTFQAQSQTGVREETVWFNYIHPKKLHDSRYIGDNYRERQNIKRRQERLKHKVDVMCPIERTEFIRWLTAKYAA